ncbi:recombinase family protein [Streptomyces decoyicus]|uniref:recombinase family protein n=1 Tax=Streptomyces decoyicus TaxID=249567 RepID=UPI000A865290|nr:recombinase family protein [Streptomyces decoyicus]
MRPWRPGTPPPAPIDPDLPSADIRIGYARCSTLGQELDSQLDALSKRGIPRDKIFSEKISTRVRVRPRFEEALRTAREVKAHAPHCRAIFTVCEMKRPGRDAAELTALADHLTAHGPAPPGGDLLRVPWQVSEVYIAQNRQLCPAAGGAAGQSAFRTRLLQPTAVPEQVPPAPGGTWHG